MAPHLPSTAAALLALALGPTSAGPMDASTPASAASAAAGAASAAVPAITTQPVATSASTQQSAVAAPGCAPPRLVYGAGYERRRLHGLSLGASRACDGSPTSADPRALRAERGAPPGSR